MSSTFFSELNTAIYNVLLSLEGRNVSDELFDELAEQLNIATKEVYDRHNVPFVDPVTREVIIHMFNRLIERGDIEIREKTRPEVEPESYPTSESSHLYNVKPSDQTTRPYLQDDANQYDPVAAEHAESSVDSTIEVLNTLWQQCVNNRQFIEAEAILTGIAALSAVNVGSPEHGTTDVDFPEGWGEKLVGNFDASHWADEFKILLSLKPEWAKDQSYLTGWFANAIMTGYDKAKSEEYPVAERGPEDYVYVEFYDVQYDEWAPRSTEVSEIILKFQTLAAAKEFVKLNAFGETFKSKYYRFYELKPSTTYKKTEIK